MGYFLFSAWKFFRRNFSPISEIKRQLRRQRIPQISLTGILAFLAYRWKNLEEWKFLEKSEICDSLTRTILNIAKIEFLDIPNTAILTLRSVLTRSRSKNLTATASDWANVPSRPLSEIYWIYLLNSTNWFTQKYNMKI